MTRKITLHLEPTGQQLAVEAGTPLQDALFDHGVEFPCGGHGLCGKCRVKIEAGRLDPSPEDTALLGEDAVADGWRLACRGRLHHDATLHLAQWEAQVLSDEAAIDVCPRDGWGIAIDLGTTTVVAQLVDLETGSVLAVESGMNPQAARGADVMSRIHHAVHEGGARRLTAMIRQYLGGVAAKLLVKATRMSPSPKPVREAVLVGNTAMHHFFCDHSSEPLARVPFNTPNLAETVFPAAELGWDLPADCPVRFLPCLGGFIGSDVLAGVLATGMDESPRLRVLVDLGTNGEMVIADGARMLCAATAAGPAFEGARISSGMRATRGAIDRVTIAEHNGRRGLACHILGGVEPSGVCGSGLIDAVACALELAIIDPTGRLQVGGDLLPLEGGVNLHQCDIRELQLAKGAIAAGVEVLLSRLHRTSDDVEEVFLCGAFGNYLKVGSARRLGLLPFAADKIHAMGNTALRGAKLALLGGEKAQRRIEVVCRRIEHVGISEDRSFMDVYVRNMTFPA